MPFPGGTYINQIRSAVQWVADELEQFYALLEGWLRVEHDEDGHHTDVTAQSMTVAGDVTAGGDVTVTGGGAFGGDVSAANLTVGTAGSGTDGSFTHRGLLFEEETSNTTIATPTTLVGNPLAFNMNIRVTAVAGLGPSLVGADYNVGTMGTVYRFFNASGSSFTVENEKISVTAASRILTPAGRTVRVYDGDSFWLFRDTTTDRWRMMYTGGGADSGSWTPIDASGAGLTFASAVGTWTRVLDRLLFECQVIYPATASGAAALIGGLPAVSVPNGAAAQGFGLPHLIFLLPAGTTTIQPLDATSSGVTNAALTGANLVISGQYRI